MPPSRRPARVSDILIVVATTAVGLAIFNLVVAGVLWEKNLLGRLLQPPDHGWDSGAVVVRGVEWIGPTLPFTCAWSCTLIALRLRAPRPPARRLWRQPGLVACVAATIGLAWAALGLGAVLAVDRLFSDRLGSKPQVWLFHFLVEELFPYIGLAVAVAWIVLALTRQWTRPADWIDRFGRLLGGYWIVVGLVWACRRYLVILY